jgi:glycosyl transferase family 25
LDVYVINLDRSPERLAHMAAMLGGLGVAFQRVPAIDGRKLGEAEVKRLAPDGGLFAGEIGCFLSHRECWRRIAAGASGSGIVLEDDVRISPGLSELAATSGWVPDDADIVKLESRPGVSAIIDRESLPAGTRRLARLRGAHLCTGGYAITKAGARKLLAASETLSTPVDNFMFDPASPAFKHVAIYQLVPALLVQEQFLTDGTPAASDSTLDIDRAQRGITLSRKLVREAVRPFRQAAEALSIVVHRRRRAKIPFA